MLGPAQRRTLSGEVTRAIRQAVLTGVYQPGDHLTEAEIAREMGVSHGPVREALRELEAENLIIIEPHRGPIVRALRAGDAIAATRYMEQAVGDVGEQIADAMGSAMVAVPRPRQAG